MRGWVEWRAALVSISFRLSRRHARDPWRESWMTEAGKLCFPMSRSRVLIAMLALIEEIDRMGHVSEAGVTSVSVRPSDRLFSMQSKETKLVHCSVGVGH